MSVEDRIEELLSNKFEDYCRGVEIPYGASLRILMEMILEKSGIEDEYIHVNLSDDKKLKKLMNFNKEVTYLQMLKQICTEGQLDIYLDDNGIFIME